MPTDPLQRLRDLALEAPDLDSQDGQSWVAEVTELLSQLDRPNEAHDLGRYADGSHPEADEGELSEPQRRARVNEIVERAVTAHETRRDDRPQLTELSKHEKMAGQRGMPVGIKAAWITGECLIVAAVIAALTVVRPPTNASEPENQVGSQTSDSATANSGDFSSPLRISHACETLGPERNGSGGNNLARDVYTGGTDRH